MSENDDQMLRHKETIRQAVYRLNDALEEAERAGLTPRMGMEFFPDAKRVEIVFRGVGTRFATD